MNVLLSIRPKYVNLIMDGMKKYEFRRKIFRLSAEKVYIYCTDPVKKITGFFVIDDILSDSPTKIWRVCKDDSGVTKKEFFAYFQYSKNAYAIKIRKVKQWKEPIEIKNTNLTIPQSFCYLKKDIGTRKLFC